jgi:EAL domain-containing protein (putative c-di-GMP-specific phosphodiesterase class I)
VAYLAGHHLPRPTLQIAPHRLLGFAFAVADLLLEVAPTGKISFAVGAAAVLAGDGERQLIGRSFMDYIEPDDQDLVWALINGAEGGTRQGPAIARLASGAAKDTRAFSIAICKLPQNEGAVSCALSRAAAPKLGKGEGGLHERGDFEGMTRSLLETARTTGEELELSFVEMDGLSKAAEALPAQTQTVLKSRIAGALRAQSHGGAAAAKLDEDRYALVRAAGESAEALTERLGRLISLTADVDGFKLATSSMSLSGDASASQIVKAVRYALDDFIEGGIAGTVPGNLQDAVTASVRHTLKKASALGAMVTERRFKLVYQPVVTLASGALHHHEVLVRFGEEESPFPMIRMAEELDLIEELDFAVFERACEQLDGANKLRLAVNISGRTITSADFIKKVTDLAKAKKSWSGRLMFELTESATIDDLQLADKHIQMLREHGCLVCLDDFGAGAASLAYLQQLRLDVVKIDGRYIRELQHGKREATFIRHLVQMCGDLGVKTLAEMVETPQIEDAVRRAGVDFGQGYLYGAAAETPSPPASRTGPVAARRVGSVESWG